MITSIMSLLSIAQAITATAISANVMDLGIPGTPYGGAAPLDRDFGKGTPVPILIQVVEDFATCTSVTITLETGPNADFTSSTRW